MTHSREVQRELPPEASSLEKLYSAAYYLAT